MEMTMSAVSAGASTRTPASTDSSLGSGFSEVLSDVRGSVQENAGGTAAQVGKAERSAPAEAPDKNANADSAASAEQTAQSAQELSDAVAQIVQTLSGKIEGESEFDGQDSVIRALLAILKKMQKNGEADEAVDAVMQLLASMLEQNSCDVASMAVSVTISETSAEISQITSEPQQTGTVVNSAVQLSENAAETGVVPSENVQQNGESDKTLSLEQNRKTGQTEIFDLNEQPSAEENTLPPVNTENKAEQLLNELLSQARRELGLTKAEATPNDGGNAASETAPAENAPQNDADLGTLALRMNRRDSTRELNSIIQSDKSSETQQAPDGTEQPTAAFSAVQPEVRELQNLHEEPTQVHAAPPEQQLAEEILSRTETLNGGGTEFTMELNPESLGKITVKLVSTHGRVEVSISAENEETGRLLQSRGENISSALRENGIELERYQVVSGREEAQLMQDSYDGSSKNPYGRNDDEDNSENNDDGEFLELLSQL